MATSKVTGLIWPGGATAAPATWHKVATWGRCWMTGLVGIRAVDDDVGELAERWKGGGNSSWLIVFITFNPPSCSSFSSSCSSWCSSSSCYFWLIVFITISLLLPPQPLAYMGRGGAITVKIFSSPQPSLNIFSSPRSRLYCNYIVVAIIEDTYAYMPPHTDQSDSNKLNIKAHPPKKQNILTI